MTFLGIPIFEWAALAFALGLGAEHWLTMRRDAREERERVRRSGEEVTKAEAHEQQR
ncbi:MAG: hypothetical protein ACT4QA_09355 [Panacagrimonas sp.]